MTTRNPLGKMMRHKLMILVVAKREAATLKKG